MSPTEILAPPSYREYRPGSALHDYVECFWIRRGAYPPGISERNRILPDGCIDIIFNLGEPPELEGRAGHGLRSYIVGAMTGSVTYRLRGAVDILGVRFRPGGAAVLLGLAAHELTDRTVALADAWPRRANLIERLAETTAPGERLAVLEGELITRARSVARPHAAVAFASSLIDRTGGTVSVSDLGHAVNLSARQLRRLFHERVGVSPKLACRIARFKRAAAALREAERGGWARIVHECGYHDQAHLIREFRELAGLAPGAYLRERMDGRFVQYAPHRERAD